MKNIEWNTMGYWNLLVGNRLYLGYCLVLLKAAYLFVALQVPLLGHK